jgi:hypothetical protein
MLNSHKYSEVNIKNIGFFDKYFLDYYDKDQQIRKLLCIETGSIVLTDNKISTDPKSNTSKIKLPRKKYPIDLSKQTLKITLDKKQEKCQELQSYLKQLDTFFSSKKFKKKFFGNKWNICEYQPIIIKHSKNLSYCNLKFQKNSSDEITTRMVKNVNGEKNIKEISHIDDIYNEIRFMTKIKLIFKLSHVWSEKYVINNKKKIIYGISLIIRVLGYAHPDNIHE